MRTMTLLAMACLQGCALVCLPNGLSPQSQDQVQGQVLAPSAWLDPAQAGGPDQAAAGVELVLADASGRALPGSLRAVSDAEGRFSLSVPLGAEAFYVLARGQGADGRAWLLVALAKVGQKDLLVDWAATAALARLGLARQGAMLPASTSVDSALRLATEARQGAGLADAPLAPPPDPVAAAVQALPPEAVAPAPAPPAPAPEAPPEPLDAFAPIYAPRR